MKSPFTGKEMKRISEHRQWKFRGELFDYLHVSWICEDTGEQFTTDESDTAGYIQAVNQYRVKYGIPFTDEIIGIRKRYDISASRMSLVLGLGPNQYRLYEQGEIPNVSNGRMIRSAMNPRVMLDLVRSTENMMSQTEFERTYKKISNCISEEEKYAYDKHETMRIYGTIMRGNDNGYAPLSLVRLRNLLLFILDKCHDVWCTKMNKLLYYIDFLSYKVSGMSISGLSYRAIEFGPVPENWDRVYSAFPEVRQELCSCGDFVGHILKTDCKPDMTLFTENELCTINKVCNSFKKTTSKELTLLSHKETGWNKCYESKERIPFNTAFDLKGI